MPPQRRKKGVQSESVAPPPPTFQFINLSDEAKIRADDDRSIIREVVMNNYHQKRKQKNISNHEQVPPGGSVTINTPISKQINVFQLNSQPISTSSHSRNLAGTSKRDIREVEGDVISSVNNNSLPSNDLIVPASQLVNSPSATGISTRSPGNEEAIRGDDEAVVQRMIENLVLPQPLNPMTCLPASATNRSQYLIDRFFQDRGWSSLLMMGVRKSWFQASLQDLAYFNVVLAHYSACITLLTKAGDPVESLVLRMEASKIINERLDAEEISLSDGTIGAVASLLMYEANNGNHRAILTHMIGLHRMINLKGGFRAAGFMPAVQRQIAWAEITISNTLSISPTILPFSSPDLGLPAYTYAAPAFHSSTGETTDHIIDFSVLCTDLEIIFEDLRYLTKVLESQSLSFKTDSSDMFYSDKTYLVQRSLNYLTISCSSVTQFNKTFCLAASIFSHIYLRDLGFFSGIVGNMVTKLQMCLESVIDAGEVKEEGDVRKLIWVLVIGAIAAWGKEERGFFLEKLLWLGASLPEGVGGKEELREIVRGILWTRDWDRWFDLL